MRQELERRVADCEETQRVVSEKFPNDKWRAESAESNLRSARSELAAFNAGDHVVSLDREAFYQRAVELFGHSVRRVDGVRVYNRKFLGAAYKKPEEVEARPDHWILYVGVKTGRAPMDSGDCDGLGVCDPSGGAEAAAKKLAEEFGLKSRGFSPCEKGWGDFSFEAAPTA